MSLSDARIWATDDLYWSRAGGDCYRGGTEYVRADLYAGLLRVLRDVKAAQAAGELSYRTSSGCGYEAMLAVDAALDAATATPRNAP